MSPNKKTASKRRFFCDYKLKKPPERVAFLCLNDTDFRIGI